MLTSAGRIFLSSVTFCLHLIRQTYQVCIGLFDDRHQNAFLSVRIDFRVFNCFPISTVDNISYANNPFPVITNNNIPDIFCRMNSRIGSGQI